MSKMIPYDAGIILGASEIVSIDLDMLNGAPVTPKAGLEYPFPTAGKQWSDRMVQLRWITFKENRQTGNMQPGDGIDATLTLRDVHGNYIAENLPLWRIYGTIFNNWAGNIDLKGRLPFWTPVHLDWKRCFLRLVAVPPRGVTVRIRIDYEPRND